jgi:hypothetical protein
VFVAFIKLIQGGELRSRVTVARFLWPFFKGIYMRVMIVCHPCGPCRKGRLHDVEGREKEEERGSELGREEGKETATRERGRHKKKIIQQMLIHNRSPARSLISSSSHAPPLPSFPLLSHRL